MLIIISWLYFIFASNRNKRKFNLAFVEKKRPQTIKIPKTSILSSNTTKQLAEYNCIGNEIESYKNKNLNKNAEINRPVIISRLYEDDEDLSETDSQKTKSISEENTDYNEEAHAPTKEQTNTNNAQNLEIDSHLRELTYKKLLKKFNSIGFLKLCSTNLSGAIKDIICKFDADIIFLEENTLFRFYSSFKLLKNLRIKANCILDDRSTIQDSVSFKEYVNDFIFNDFKTLDLSEGTTLFRQSKTCPLIENPFFLNHLQDSFNNFLGNQFEKFKPILLGKDYFFRNYKIFQNILLEKCHAISFYTLIFKNTFELPKFSFILFLFPEIPHLIKLLENSYRSIRLCKTVFFVFEFILIKSILLKEKIGNELNLFIDGFLLYDYQHSKTLCNYILDVRSLIYLTSESILPNSGVTSWEKNREILLRTFFDYVRIVAPQIFRMFDIDEFFFVNYTLKELKSLTVTINSYFLKECKKRFKYRIFEKFTKNHHPCFNCLKSFSQAMLRDYLDKERSEVTDVLGWTDISDRDVKNYFGMKKTQYTIKLIEEINK